jgi:hypothetical protein
VNEFTFRFNRRTVGMQQVFTDMVNGVAESKNLYYNTLIQKEA